jgi:hypothetical protein
MIYLIKGLEFTTLYKHLSFFLYFLLGGKRKYQRNTAQKSNRMALFTRMPYATWGPKPSGSHICLRRARSFRLSKELNTYSLGFGVAYAPLKK